MYVKFLIVFFLPFVSFEIFQFHPERILLVIGEHINIFVPQPKFLGRIAETVFVVVPVAIEILPGDAEIVATLDNLKKKPNHLPNTVRRRVKTNNMTVTVKKKKTSNSSLD